VRIRCDKAKEGRIVDGETRRGRVDDDIGDGDVEESVRGVGHAVILPCP